MPTKKQSSTWYIAATHYLTAGLVVPLIGGLILAFALKALNFSDSDPATRIIQTLGALVLIFFGVMYAASYVRKTYVVSNPSAVVNWATGYLVVLHGGFISALILLAMNNGAPLPDAMPLATTYGTVAIEAVVFYLSSKRFITASA